MGLPPYPAVVCSSVNDVIVHGIPSRAKLKEGDIVGLDFGSILDGFVGDGAITVPVGKVTPRTQELIDTTRECLELAIDEMRAGQSPRRHRCRGPGACRTARVPRHPELRRTRHRPPHARGPAGLQLRPPRPRSGAAGGNGPGGRADALRDRIRSSGRASSGQAGTESSKTCAPTTIVGRPARSTERWPRISSIRLRSRPTVRRYLESSS